MINKCLFPAAGFGTRFLPATKAVPKEMLPILTKPLLQYGVEEALSAGINNMAIVTGRGKRAIEDHFDSSFELEAQLKGSLKEHYLEDIKDVLEKATFTYVRQKEILGLGHAILTGKPLIGNEPFAVILADDLCDYDESSVMSQMVKIYEEYKCSIVAIEEVPINQTNKYGIISGDYLDNKKEIVKISNMIEKPDIKDSPSNLAIIGRYILTPDIFDILKKIKPSKNQEIQITDALLVQAKIGKVIGIKFKGKRFDCGSVNGYVEATNHYAKKLKIL
ncbi:UTP--glucose-1-phosphate uridylyltransferase GalU [bacterium]|jgi:UTP--glucose-1-phosphate uridylyltransferase|nr:UTP--glucose-1-phosphate uridylyltransferase GalU [bacterium]